MARISENEEEHVIEVPKDPIVEPAPTPDPVEVPEPEKVDA